MTVFGALGFTTPWLLLGLLALPVLWFLLRAVPPAPLRRRFPGVALLLGLRDEEQVTDHTPWWLLLLRLLAMAAVIVGLAGPVLNPQSQGAPANTANPLVIVVDGGWTSAPDWPVRLVTIEAALTQAARRNQPAAVLNLSDPTPLQFSAAEVLLTRLPGLIPSPWTPTPDHMQTARDLLPDRDFDTLWLSDGTAREGRLALLGALEEKGRVTISQSVRNRYLLRPATVQNGTLTLSAARLDTARQETLGLVVRGKDPAGYDTVLSRAELDFATDTHETSTQVTLPAELRARITRFELEGHRSAGAIALADDGLHRREVALVITRQGREGLELLAPLHYLRKALVPTADLVEGPLSQVLPANPDVIVLADVATLGPTEETQVLDWVENGGLLLRFSGPRLAASDVSRITEDLLMPVRLRSGGRSVGGAMSWGEPKALAPFDATSPFAGLTIPDDVTVSSQVMAQPDPTLSERVIAQLSDGTPLVTRKPIGQGQVVLFHVTANAEWSTLPLSGLFVEMLERLAVTTSTASETAETLKGTLWQPQQVLDGFGRSQPADTLPSVAGPDLVDGPLGPDLRPGIYAHETRMTARNVAQAQSRLDPVQWPPGTLVTGLVRPQERPLGGWLLAGAMVLLAADILATLALSGRLIRLGAAMLILGMVIGTPHAGRAQGAPLDPQAILAASELVLAHVLTGDSRIDSLAEAGLRGLSDTLYFRTSVEPAAPVGLDLERDELAFYPLLYWPITPSQPTPSAQAYARLNAYLQSGGMILFDTRDADIAGFGAGTPNGRKLQELAAPLTIPALAPVPQDHVLTRTFYLLNDFPGRYAGHQIWVEASAPDAQQVEGMPFRDLNDNVTPVVIGGNDWASAWAIDQAGNPLVPLGRGFSAERQREIAYRFGVNLVMHVLTGNYKSDQVHVPALLDRLGQ
ncbi:MAG: DUF4159 domain-containing protein [Pelagimonas sp.]|jgi:hypothetical protein|nr:DUF4159 domain-containing protein [Pelagimonas sp.]